MKKIGLWLAIAALLVNGPRFVIIFLRIDNIDLPLQAEATMLGATGVATGLVLTGGGAYIAHSLAESKARGMTQFVMVFCWFLLLLFSVVLLAPLMVSAIRISPLQLVLASTFSQWIWSITAVAAVEIIAAGAMAAYAIEERSSESYLEKSDNSTFSILSNALVRRLEKGIANETQPVATGIVPPPSEAATVAQASKSVTKPIESQVAEPEQVVTTQQQAEMIDGNEQSIDPDEKYSKKERQALLLKMLAPIQSEEEIQVEEYAKKLFVSRQTIYRDLAELKSQKLLQVEGNTVKVDKQLPTAQVTM